MAAGGGVILSCGAWASLSGGFSCCKRVRGLQELHHKGSVVAARL